MPSKHNCPCACHPANEGASSGRCKPGLGGKKAKHNKKARAKPADVNLTTGVWLAGEFRSKFAVFCGQDPGCTRLCRNCCEKWERQLEGGEKAAYENAKSAASASGKQDKGGRTNKAAGVLGDSGSQAMAPGDQGT